MINLKEVFSNPNNILISNYLTKEKAKKISDIVIDNILNNIKENKKDFGLSKQSEIFFNFPILLYSLNTKNIINSLKIFEKWFSNSSILPNEEYNLYFRNFLEKIPLSLNEIPKDLIFSSFNIFLPFLKFILIDSNYFLEDLTYQYSLKLFLECIKFLRLLNYQDSYNTQLVNLFCKCILKVQLKETQQKDFIIEFSENCNLKNDWPSLIDHVVKSLFSFEKSNYCLSLLSIIKLEMSEKSEKFNSDIINLSFGIVLHQFSQSIHDKPLFNFFFPIDFFLSLFGDWAFFKINSECDSLDQHIKDIFLLFKRSLINTDSKWFFAFSIYISYLLSLDNSNSIFSIINNSSDFFVDRPDLSIHLSQSILKAAVNVQVPNNKLSNLLLSGEWVNLFSNFFMIFKSLKLENLEQKIIFLITKFSSAPFSSNGPKPMFFHRLILLGFINGTGQFCSQISRFQNYIFHLLMNKSSINNVIKKVHNSIILSLSLLPFLFIEYEKFALNSLLFQSIIPWFDSCLNYIEDPTFFYTFLLTLYILSKKTSINESFIILIDPLLEIKKPFLNKNIWKFMKITRNSILIPTILPINLYSLIKDCEIDHYSKDNRIISIASFENHFILIIRGDFGISSFVLETKNLKNNIILDSTMKSGILHLLDINFNNLKPFKKFENIFNSINIIKSKSLNLLYSIGIFENLIHLKNPNFDLFDSLCIPSTISISITCINSNSIDLIDEPIQSHNFNIFLLDLGTFYDMSCCYFEFQVEKIGLKEISIIFVDSRFSLKELKFNHLTTKCIIVVSLDFTLTNNNERLYKIHILHVNEQHLVMPLPNNIPRIVTQTLLSIVISSICLYYYSQVDFHKNSNEIFCSLITDIEKKTKLRKLEIKNIIENSKDLNNTNFYY